MLEFFYIIIALNLHFIFHLPKYKMSQANAAARKRRAGGASLQEVPTTPVQAQNRVQAPSSPNTGLTLPQVISLVDKRLTTLETFMRESQSETTTAIVPDNKVNEEALNMLAEDINSKFVMLAGEVENLKDIVLKLQAYTMEVNKTLYEERIQVLSDMGTTAAGGLSASVSGFKQDNIVFDLSEDGEETN